MKWPWASRREVDYLESRVRYLEEQVRDERWEIVRTIEMLEAYLGVQKRETHRHEYVKKGGPERGEQ